MAESKDYYKILGLDRNASDADIKKAYKKLAVKWHPDRWGNKSEKEQKEAEEKFKEINEANDVLSDPDKKSRYDRFGSVDGADFDPFAGFGDFFGGFGRQRQRGPEPGETLQYNLNISIEELFNGINKDIEYYVNVRCHKCNGEGGLGVETCPYCNGTGMITETQRTAFGIMQNMHPCNHCNGTGKTVKEKCKECNGTGFKREKRKIHINIPAGVQHGQYYKYSGSGNEAKDTRGATGDLIIVVSYSFDTNRYKVKGNTVYELVEIPYYDCILGATKTIKLPNGKTEEYNIPQYTHDGDQIVLNGKGLNHAHYIIIVKTTLPKSITKTERELLEKIKEIHK